MLTITPTSSLRPGPMQAQMMRNRRYYNFRPMRFQADTPVKPQSVALSGEALDNAKDTVEITCQHAG